MSKREIRPMGSYQAFDGSGKQHTIHVFQEFVQVLALNAPPSWLAGLKRHKMSNGNHVNVHDDGTLEDIHTGLKMRRLPGG